MTEEPKLWLDADTANSMSLRITAPPMFPTSVVVGAATIRLNADGTWEGDGDAFLAELKETQMFNTEVSVSLWLVANAIRNSKKV